ncbi:MAG: tagatose-bisphosphate aldolase [Candidatus Ryanbacteria bacterium CG10_big_fil_rev_8_21_14_0_10_43_42]|uniref:Tagatose-bisphosphate aldolase n=1 Tax=Candidatus Ryanbacteria bacterium CG10_big_fil_rev_8_21_14_0_10_43_42 TaxID=1974864 RepID=A0A2M8KX41_9BACT|nr:MAG: tagatose-bisphosphate aldolase [Candidatus Ryanbacteria bacterium CG10_big_fil_rev_8_21_14_0_10_43_42]
MLTLQEILRHTRTEQHAIGHFNISNLDMFRGIMEGAKAVNASAVMIGTSEGEAAFIGRRQALALTESMRDEYGIIIYLNADHHKSVAAAKEAIDAGYTSIHIDLSKEPYEKNLAGVKEVVDYAKSKNPAISVEGELGYLPTDSSKIYDETVSIPEGSLTQPEEAAVFVKETGIDRFAAAIGNLHGIAANEPQLDFERIKAIKDALPEDVALVLHGGSGIPLGHIKEAIALGMNNVHVSTELRVAYITTLRKAFAENEEETTPYKLFPPGIEAIKNIVKEKITLFTGK